MSTDSQADIGMCTKCGNIVELTKYRGKDICLPCWFELTDDLIYRVFKVKDEELKDG